MQGISTARVREAISALLPCLRVKPRGEGTTFPMNIPIAYHHERNSESTELDAQKSDSNLLWANKSTKLSRKINEN